MTNTDTTTAGQFARDMADKNARLHHRFWGEFNAATNLPHEQQSALANASALSAAAGAALQWVHDNISPEQADEMAEYMQHYAENGCETDEFFAAGEAK